MWYVVNLCCSGEFKRFELIQLICRSWSYIYIFRVFSACQGKDFSLSLGKSVKYSSKKGSTWGSCQEVFRLCSALPKCWHSGGASRIRARLKLAQRELRCTLLHLLVSLQDRFSIINRSLSREKELFLGGLWVSSPLLSKCYLHYFES